ncbi:MAG TPA: response regulator [Anaeromyxobacteraceae bacterium]|nr:response regulator [Anaeromyxobacteraceae bacterium]
MPADLPRILVVEDDPNDLELTLTALREGRIANEIDAVRDGDAALDYLFRRGPFAGKPASRIAVVLLDLKLPKVDGLDVLRAIKADPVLHSTPVVVLTSSKEEKDLVRSYELGVNAFVVKPVDFPEFIESVKQVGLFWAVLNEPPPRRSSATAGAP